MTEKCNVNIKTHDRTEYKVNNNGFQFIDLVIVKKKNLYPEEKKLWDVLVIKQIVWISANVLKCWKPYF